MSDIFLNTIIKNGTSYDEQVDFVRAISKMGLDISGIELRREFFSNSSSERDEQFACIKSIGNQNRWQLRYSIPESMFDNNGLNPEICNYIDEVEKLGAISLKLNIGDLEGIKKVSLDYLKSTLPDNVLITVENDQTEKNGVLEEVLQALELIEEKNFPIGYTFDVGNWLVMGEDAEEAFIKLKNKITLIHLKNTLDGDTVLLNQGELNWRKFISKEWPIGIEYPMDMVDLKKEYQLIKEEL